MVMVEAYKKVWKNFANFNGRASRADYWWFVLANMIVSAVISLLAVMGGDSFVAVIFSALSGLYSLAILIPTLALSVRRLHDINKSGWWYLINLVPCIGVIVFLVFCCIAGTPGDNQYGPDPYQVTYVYEG